MSRLSIPPAGPRRRKQSPGRDSRGDLNVPTLRRVITPKPRTNSAPDRFDRATLERDLLEGMRNVIGTWLDTVLDPQTRGLKRQLKTDLTSTLTKAVEEALRTSIGIENDSNALQFVSTPHSADQQDRTMHDSQGHSGTADKAYAPRTIERTWYKAWEQAGYFAPSGDGPPYCIMIPPPNVTGTLHMGHAFQATLMDTLIRYHRMKGHKTLWQAGTDHAGIATQMVVERQLAAEGRSRHDLGREEFIARVWDWKAHSGGTITEQLRRLGASLDWSRERFTLDEGLSEAVREVFVRLYAEGLIYRGKRLVNWDPVLHTAVSDLEVINQAETGHLWHIRYPVIGDNSHVVVATTRPETMLGDVAVAVHPEDERYRHLVGRRLRLPLTQRTIPVIADDYVDPTFGSGCVKITPAHDFNDYNVWERHKDSDSFRNQPFGGLINVFTIDAHIKADALDDFAFGHRATGTTGAVHLADEEQQGPATYELIPVDYRGLDRYAARERIVADLQTHGLVEKIEPHALTVPRGDRSHAVLEPYLTDQWFVRTQALAEPAIKAVENGEVRFVPENWKNTYFEWMRNIQDWCISRQIWWGHRVPAWYDDRGQVYVGKSEAQVRRTHGLDDEVTLTQDPDVLDTWFSSALWPFSTLGWPEDTPELRSFYPTQVLVTGFDIIFFWVARMIMMGLKFTGAVPFREVYIHGLVRDAEGQKMSKSKGNVLDPIDLIDGIDLDTLVRKRTSSLMQPHMAARVEKATRAQFPNGIPAFGTDALRFTFAALASTGRDIRFDMGRVEGYRNFCNKLWNAARYVLMNTEGRDVGLDSAERELGVAERWIISRLQVATELVTQALAAYRFDLAAQAIYEFAWNEYCDWYLELSKPALATEGASDAQRRGTRHTLVTVLENLLRLAHPIIPFITEELWHRVAPLAGASGPTVMREPYPKVHPELVDTEAVEEIEWIMQFIMGVRKVRSGMNIPPAKPLPVLLQGGNDTDFDRAQAHRGYLMALARLADITWLPPEADAPESATALVGQMKVLIPLAGLIDKEAELARLARATEKLDKDISRSEAKLANPNYVERAPGHVVEQERQRLQELRSALEKLEEEQARIEGLAP